MNALTSEDIRFLRERIGEPLYEDMLPKRILQCREKDLFAYGLRWEYESVGADRSARCVVPCEPSSPVHVVRTLPQRPLAKADISNTLFEGDCLEVLPYFPAQSVSLILCDLPYGTTQNAWDSVIPLNKLWQAYWRVLKPDGVIILTAQGIFTARLILSQTQFFKYKIVWEKSKPTNFLNAKKQPLRKHEDVCVFYRKQPTYHPQMSAGEPYDKGVRKAQLSGSYGDFRASHVKSAGERYPTDVVYFKTAESEGDVWHPTQKPVALGQYFIRTFSNPGDLVLDNAFGSGSFLVAAAKEGRRFVGIERNVQVQRFKAHDIDFVHVAEMRLKQALGTTRA